MPTTATEKVADCPAVTVVLSGWVVMYGARRRTVEVRMLVTGEAWSDVPGTNSSAAMMTAFDIVVVTFTVIPFS